MILIHVICALMNTNMSLYNWNYLLLIHSIFSFDCSQIMRIGHHTGNISFIWRPRIFSFSNTVSASAKADLVRGLNGVQNIQYTCINGRYS